jgi:hypothetical protein
VCISLYRRIRDTVKLVVAAFIQTPLKGSG